MIKNWLNPQVRCAKQLRYISDNAIVVIKLFDKHLKIQQMKRILYLSLWILSFCSLNANSQNFVLDERSVEKYYVYSDQMDLIIRSLSVDKIYKQIKFDESCVLTTRIFDSLSILFKTYLPDSFFNHSVPYIDTKKIISSSDFVKYTFAHIDKDDKITIYFQLIVNFKIDPTITTYINAHVLSIDINSIEKIVPINNKNTLELYKERMIRETNDSTPSPPPPPIINYYKN